MGGITDVTVGKIKRPKVHSDYELAKQKSPWIAGTQPNILPASQQSMAASIINLKGLGERGQLCGRH